MNCIRPFFRRIPVSIIVRAYFHVPLNISGKKSICITVLVRFCGYFTRQVFFILIIFGFELISVCLLLNNASPGRVLCDSSGRKRIKTLNKIDIFDIRSAFFG